MTSAYHYENAVEERLHHDAIERLARELGRQEEQIQALYEETLCGIRQEARVKEFLVILVSREVKELVRSLA